MTEFVKIISERITNFLREIGEAEPVHVTGDLGERGHQKRMADTNEKYGRSTPIKDVVHLDPEEMEYYLKGKLRVPQLFAGEKDEDDSSS